MNWEELISNSNSYGVVWLEGSLKEIEAKSGRFSSSPWSNGMIFHWKLTVVGLEGRHRLGYMYHQVLRFGA